MANNISLLKYLKMDLYRSFFSLRFLIASIGVFLSLLWQCADLTFFGDVLSSFAGIHLSIAILLVFIFCAFPYASCFSEDFEGNNQRWQIIRGGINKYVLSKIITICLISILTAIVGVLIFVLIMRCFIPWLPTIRIPGSKYASLVSYGKFPLLITTSLHILYYTCLAFCMGLLSSILSLFSAWASLYISNKMLVLIIPVIVYYIFDIISSKIKFPFIYIFTSPSYTLKNTTTTVCIAVAFTLVIIISMYFIFTSKIKRRISNE